MILTEVVHRQKGGGSHEMKNWEVHDSQIAPATHTGEDLHSSPSIMSSNKAQQPSYLLSNSQFSKTRNFKERRKANQATKKKQTN